MASLKFIKLKVEAFDLDHLDLSWELEDTSEDPERWGFYILRSIDGPGGPFETIAGPFLNNNQFRDAEVNTLHNWRTYFYKVRAVNKDDGREVEVGPAFLSAEPDIMTIELRRRFEILMQEWGGRRVIVYPAITTGFRCRHCFDRGSNDRGRSIGRQKIQNCPSCYDMTFVGGFGKPVLSWMQIDPAADDVQRTDTTERSKQDTSARLSFFPPLKPKDMIVEAENVRWQVERVASTKKLRAVVHQEPVIHRIPRNDVRYEIPVEKELLREAGPAREFTRPMNLESAQCAEPTELADFLDGVLGD
jgi:hypothetical protein